MGRKKAAAGVNKSQAIRDYLESHAGATAKEIVPALAAQGIEVTEGLVNNVKSTSRMRKRKKGAGVKKLVRKRTVLNGRSSGLATSDLFEAKKFVDVVGGIAEARKALDTLEALR